MKKIVLLLVLLLPVFVFAQETEEDLQKKLEKAKSDQEKADALNDLALFMVNNDPDQAKMYAIKAKVEAEKSNYQDGIGFALYNLGNVNYYLDEYEDGLKNLKSAEEIFIKSKNSKGLGYVYNTRGEILTLMGEYGDALTSLFDGLKQFENIKDNIGLARVNNNIGLIHYYQKNHEEALKYFNQALTTADEPRTGDASLYIGRVYIEQNKFSDAQKYLDKSLEIGKKHEDNYIISDSYYLLGRVDAFYGENDKALQLFLDAIAIKEELEDLQGISLCCIHIGNLYLNKNKAREARDYFEKAKNLAREIGIKEELKNSYLGLSNSYNYLKQFDSAYHYLDLHNDVQNELLSEEASKKLAQIEASLAAQEKDAQVKAEQAALAAKVEADRAMAAYNKKVLIYSSIGIILVLLGVAAMMYNRYRLKQKANEQLTRYNEEIKMQRDIIEAHNRDILDSIKYAKRIQEAILPSNEILTENIRQFFVLYRPKDIVSGDFYWALPVEQNHKKAILFAAVDCTGHGVPGAFVSIVGYNGLNRAVKEYHQTQPAAILDKLNLLVEETFRQAGSNNIKDGMDITLCNLEYTSENSAILGYAAANNPLWLFRANGDWEEYKADKQPIGAYQDRKPFTHHEITLSKGDTVYVFSDGYADQFGGEKGKKYKYSKMREYLQSIQSQNMQEQHKSLNDEFERWMGEHEQLDDICVIGVRI